MSRTAELNQFLAGVEKRAYAMALIATKNPDDALDIVQDVMLTLARKYADKSADEWRPLFYRILRNRITDFHRANTLRNRWFGWLGRHDDADDSADPIEQVAGLEQDTPEHQHSMSHARDQLNIAIGELPDRQREAFMLRAWQGLDVKEAAQAMGCSQGSVKTHYSRAVHTLREQLEALQNE
jgi:RNA polymerase sigma-70 factor (ECF subfamily)